MLMEIFSKRIASIIPLRNGVFTKLINKSFTISTSRLPVTRPTSLLLSNKIDKIHNFSKRHKYSKKQQEKGYEHEDSDEELDSNVDDAASKVINANLSSLRMDGVIKSGLGIARNKVEVLFYESKIRLNGKKILKKSCQVKPGDEIDIINGFNKLNPVNLIISRIILVSSKPDPDANGFQVKLRRYKSMTVENYSEHPWIEN